LTGKFVNEDENDDTDIKALQAGYISVVPSHHDLTNYKSLPYLKVLEK
jgi:5'-nucleotidase